MNKTRLLWRSIRYYWKSIILIIIGIVVGTTVITGSLIIGKSVPKSLLDTATSRIGSIDYALKSTKLFTRTFLERIEQDCKQNQFASILTLSGVTKYNEITIPQVNVLGVDDKFTSFYRTPLLLNKREVAINKSLAQDLGVKKGERLILHIYRSSFVPTETLFARKNYEDNVYTLRAKVIDILSDEEMGGFRLDANPRTPRNVFVSQKWLSKQIEREHYINTLLVSGKPIENIRKYLSVEDLGIYFRENKQQLLIQSKNFIFHDYELQGVDKALTDLKEKARRASVYVVNNIGNGENTAAYSMIAGVEGLDIPPNQIYVNKWLGEDLKLGNNANIDLEYFIPTNGRLVTETKSFSVTKQLEMNHEFISSKLIPEFEGLTNADSIGDWNVPFDVDLNSISDRDEEYWELYRAAPKVFISVKQMKNIWNYRQSEQVDWVSSIIVSKNIDRGVLEEKIISHANLGFYGMHFLPIRRQIEVSSQGATDFGGLFIALNFFILLSALLLISMLTRLYTTSRSDQMGIMGACGFSHKSIRLLFLQEGLLCCFCGALLGGLAGTLYAKYIIVLLTTSWMGATGTTLIRLYADTQVIVLGAGIGFFVSWLSMYHGTRHVKMHSVLQLLKGWKSLSIYILKNKPRKYGRWSCALFFVAVISIFSAKSHFISNVAGFFVAGTSFLGGCYCVLGYYWQRSPSSQLSYLSLVRKNLALYRDRSLLLFVLFAFSSFLFVALAVNKNDFSDVDLNDKNSGTGGFALQAKASFPIHHDMNSSEGREKLGFDDNAEGILSQNNIFSALFFKGQDISCLNLAKATVPNIVGVSDRFIERGGFIVSSAVSSSNPWSLLNKKSIDGTIPVFGDANSVLWSLHSGMGKTIDLVTAVGSVKLRFVGLLHNSIFASEIVMSENNFRELFPHISSPTYYLIEANNFKLTQKTLQKTLGEMGVSVKTTTEILNGFIQVQNTYLLAFANLGGLGIFLGIFGLAIVIVYSFIQRQGEFSLLVSLGMSLTRIRMLLFFEIVIVATLGLVCGGVSALVSVYPQVLSSQSSVDWIALLYILSGLFLFTVLVAYVTLKRVINGDLIKVLKKD
ncbi:FtsX-like permease family protein [Candidatus Uabimicrobium sp. HlEnr_7]|uniref:ABC transporter permease n=1 Tax=Candidatus Uabimicrobium helgolandensis TaxID=3095367 RepID=UPI003557145E